MQCTWRDRQERPSGSGHRSGNLAAQDLLNDSVTRIALAVEYDGSAFCGWQRQSHSPSVQQAVETALAAVARTPIVVHCAGRTDTGVHALAQIVHFDTAVQRPLRAWSFGVNSHLPESVAVHWASEVADDFHARHAAFERSYRYTILNRATRPGMEAGRVAWIREPLDAERMHQAAQVLMGEHDFQSFRAAECQARHAIREITRIAVAREGQHVYLDIAANGFLHNMVRIVAGCLIAVGRGDRAAAWIGEVLHARDRTQGGITAPPGGLVFRQARYPSRFGIPDFTDESRPVWRPDPLDR